MMTGMDMLRDGNTNGTLGKSYPQTGPSFLIGRIGGLNPFKVH